MLSDQFVFNAGAVIGLIASGRVEPSIDLDKALEDGFITLNLRDGRDGTILALKVTEIKLEITKKK